MRDGFRPLHDFHTPVKAALIMMYSAVFVILYQTAHVSYTSTGWSQSGNLTVHTSLLVIQMSALTKTTTASQGNLCVALIRGYTMQLSMQ